MKCGFLTVRLIVGYDRGIVGQQKGGPVPSISVAIRKRLADAGVSLAANAAIGEHLLPGELEKLEAELTRHVQSMLGTLLIDTSKDHNTKGTARRVAKMYLREVFAGRYQPMPTVTDFPNVSKLDEVYTVGPIAVRSACSHHFCPIEGQAWCGIIPNGKGKVIGLSKFSRLTRWVMARPQIQEEAIVQLADLLERLIEPRGLAIVIKAKHACMTWRGVMESETTMTNSVTRGIFREAPASRQEFFSLIVGQEFACR